MDEYQVFAVGEPVSVLNHETLDPDIRGTIVAVIHVTDEEFARRFFKREFEELNAANLTKMLGGLVVYGVKCEDNAYRLCFPWFLESNLRYDADYLARIPCVGSA